MLLWFLAVALLPLFLLGYVVIRASSSTVEEEVTKRLIALTDTKARRILTYVGERRNNVATLALNPSIIDAMLKIFFSFSNSIIFWA